MHPLRKLGHGLYKSQNSWFKKIKLNIRFSFHRKLLKTYIRLTGGSTTFRSSIRYKTTCSFNMKKHRSNCLQIIAWNYSIETSVLRVVSGLPLKVCSEIAHTCR